MQIIITVVLLLVGIVILSIGWTEVYRKGGWVEWLVLGLITVIMGRMGLMMLESIGVFTNG